MEANAHPFHYSPTIVKEFIETYEYLPELWDSKHSLYLNKNSRNAALEVLLKVLQKANRVATIADVRKKINTLRSNYRRELKKIFMSRSSATADEDVYQPSSWTFYSLTFLDSGESTNTSQNITIFPADHEEIIQEIELSSSNLKTEEEEEIYVSEEVTLQPNSTIEYINEEYLEQIEQIDPPEEEPPQPPPVKKQKLITYSDNFLAKNNHLLKRVSSFLDKSEEHSLITVWSRRLEKLDANQRLFAEKAINDILYEGALGRLNKNSVKINADLNSNNNSRPA